MRGTGRGELGTESHILNKGGGGGERVSSVGGGLEGRDGGGGPARELRR